MPQRKQIGKDQPQDVDFMLLTINANTNHQGHAPEATPEFLGCQGFFGAQNDSAVQENSKPLQKQEKAFSKNTLGDKKAAKIADNRVLSASFDFYNKTNDSAVYAITHQSKDYCPRSFWLGLGH